MKKLSLFLLVLTINIASLSSLSTYIKKYNTSVLASSLFKEENYLYRIPQAYRGICSSLSKELDIPIRIIYNLIEKESKWKTNSKNKNSNGSYDIGIAQINSNNFEYFYWKLFKLEVKENIDYDSFYKNPENGLRAGFLYLRWLLNYYDNDYEKAIMAYNCGLSKVNKNQIPETTKKYLTFILTN